MNKKIWVTFNFSYETAELIKQYGEYGQLGQMIYKGNLCKFIHLNKKQKPGYYKMAGGSGVIKIKIEPDTLEKLGWNLKLGYHLIPEKNDPGLFWLIESHLNPSIFIGEGSTVKVNINGNKKAQVRRANIKDLDSTMHLIDDESWEDYRDYCRRKQGQNFRYKYGRNPQKGMHRGHQMSVRYGFLNSIPKEAIAHFKNMIEQTRRENLELGTNNLITESELKSLTNISW